MKPETTIQPNVHEPRKRPAFKKFCTQYDNPDNPTVSFAKDPGRTRQEFKKQCDVNEIVKQFIQDGDPTPFEISPTDTTVGLDAPEAQDFQTAMNTIADANAMFEELPSKIRNRFENDPMKYLSFINERDADGNLVNLDEMYDIGLAIPPAEEVIQRVIVENQPEPPPES